MVKKNVKQLLAEALASGKSPEEVAKLVEAHYSRAWQKKTVEELRAEVRAKLFSNLNKKLTKSQQEQYMYDCLNSNPDSFKSWLAKKHPELVANA